MEFGELLKQFLIDLQSLFRIQLKHLNLTLPQIMLISSIPIDGIDMTSLSRKLGIDNSTLTRLIDILLKKSIAEKNNNPIDKRSIIVSLTRKGELLQLKIEEEIERTKTKPYSLVLAALGIPGVGKRAAKLITRHISRFNNLRDIEVIEIKAS